MVNDTDLILESLRLNLKTVQTEKMLLEEKEEKIKNQINKLIQNE